MAAVQQNSVLTIGTESSNDIFKLNGVEKIRLNIYMYIIKLEDSGSYNQNQQQIIRKLKPKVR